MNRIRPDAASPSDEQSTFIDDLGGPTAVATFLNNRLGTELSPQSVSNWKRRGIPHRYRLSLTILAKDKDVDVPAGFLDDGALTPEAVEA